MAFSVSTEWDIRTGGSNSNGGGFNTAATGTDRSIQDAAYISFTDLVIDATTNTKVTSAAHPFDSTSPGNIINITSGTGFTVQRVQVVSVAAGVATCDKSLGTLSSTGGNGNLGGGLLTIATVLAIYVALNTIHIQAGTYTQTSGLSMIGGTVRIVGYQTTHNDGGTKPLITTSTNSINLLQNTVTAGWHTLDNISLTSTAGTPGYGIVANFPNSSLTLDGCYLSGFLHGINSENTSFWAYSQIWIINTEITACVNSGISANAGSVLIRDSWLHGNTTTPSATQAALKGSGFPFTLERSIISGGSGQGVYPTGDGQIHALNCAFVSLAQSALFFSGASTKIAVENCIFYGGAAIAISNAVNGTPLVQVLRNNAYGSNTGGNYSANIRAGLNDVTLSASPFTNSGAGDFSLNATAGGGASCKLAGFPGIFPGGLSTGSIDIGPVQTSGGGPAPASGGAFTFAG